MGFLDDDRELDKCLTEAASFQTGPGQIRELFATILCTSLPTNCKELWEKHKYNITADILQNARKTKNNYELQCDNDMINLSLHLLDLELIKMGKSAKQFDLPDFDIPHNLITALDSNRLIEDELNYEQIELQKELDNNFHRMNIDQKFIYDLILKKVNDYDSNLATYNGNIQFVDGPGGTGKTFLYNILLATIRKENKIAIAVASSGIASLLLPGGRTAHSRFKIPINLNEDSVCMIPRQSDEAKLLQRASVIIWDEAPMMHKHAFEALDRTMRDLMKNVAPGSENYPFGGKVILFGGDFRQILPVVIGGSRPDIVDACLNRSYLWNSTAVNYIKKKN